MLGVISTAFLGAPAPTESGLGEGIGGMWLTQVHSCQKYTSRKGGFSLDSGTSRCLKGGGNAGGKGGNDPLDSTIQNRTDRNFGARQNVGWGVFTAPKRYRIADQRLSKLPVGTTGCAP